MAALAAAVQFNSQPFLNPSPIHAAQAKTQLDVEPAAGTATTAGALFTSSTRLPRNPEAAARLG